ncbi:hypothetical protein N4P33_31735 [Streptomyces sp. 15-116A]|uniref:hypothetical protein n=1 Tax=Streptomyces sp. 15-116A TaxID=2259035 RepID=UPI0021B21785|nr:hypothetical protein [Streptomyces sp. 15-116A]MCT7356683.1 hypothetical protein [Streptomyces sp. 15-116A]
MSTEGMARRPGSVTLAVVLNALGTFLVLALSGGGPGSPGPAPWMSALYLACLWFAVRAGRGRRTARTPTVCLTVLMLVAAIPLALGDDPLYGGTTLLLGAALAVPGLLLLHTRAAEAHVRARTPAHHLPEEQ